MRFVIRAWIHKLFILDTSVSDKLYHISVDDPHVVCFWDCNSYDPEMCKTQANNLCNILNNIK